MRHHGVWGFGVQPLRRSCTNAHLAPNRRPSPRCKYRRRPKQQQKRFRLLICGLYESPTAPPIFSGVTHSNIITVAQGQVLAPAHTNKRNRLS